jgi:Zn-dependent protease with chaperone function
MFGYYGNFALRLFIMIKSITLLFCLYSVVAIANPQPKARAEWWVRSYGLPVVIQNSTIKTVELVLDRLWQASSPHSILKPKLVFISESADNWVDSLAFSLPDQSIILVESIIDLLKDQEVDLILENNHQLAFILSHELSHLINNDHRHFGISWLFQPIQDIGVANKIVEAEYRADKKALFIMTEAGFDPKKVFRDSDDNFLRAYQSKIRKKIRIVGSNLVSKHPDIEKRSDTLKNRMLSFSKKLDFFYAGVRVFHEEQFEQALSNFIQFSKTYYGREVYNNIGVTYLKIAERLVSGCDQLKFQLKTTILLDSKTQAEKLRYEREFEKKCQTGSVFSNYLNQAKEHLDQAIKKDPEYWSAKLNLSSYYLIKEEAEKALQILQAIDLPVNRRDLILNNAILADFKIDPKKARDSAIRLIEVEKRRAKPNQVFYSNLEKILEETAPTQVNKNHTEKSEVLFIEPSAIE